MWGRSRSPHVTRFGSYNAHSERRICTDTNAAVMLLVVIALLVAAAVHLEVAVHALAAQLDTLDAAHAQVMCDPSITRLCSMCRQSVQHCMRSASISGQTEGLLMHNWCNLNYLHCVDAET